MYSSDKINFPSQTISYFPFLIESIFCLAMVTAMILADTHYCARKALKIKTCAEQNQIP